MNLAINHLMSQQEICVWDGIFSHGGTEQLWFSARGKLLFFEEGMDVNEEFSHGGDDGAFVGLAPRAFGLRAW